MLYTAVLQQQQHYVLCTAVLQHKNTVNCLEKGAMNYAWKKRKYLVSCWFSRVQPGVSQTEMILVRPVTIGGQKFEIPEDPSQTLPERSPMDPFW